MMWEWSSKHFQTRDVVDEPFVGTFVSGLSAGGSGGLDVNASVLSRYRMKALPLVEWDVSPDAPMLFESLRNAGATKGYFVEHPAYENLMHTFRECEITSQVAAAIVDEGLFGWSTMFVDDKLLSVVAPCFTDFTYLCMSPALFDQFLSNHPMALDIHGDLDERPATTFQEALRGALKRLDDWSEDFPFSPNMAPQVRAELSWQLVRTA